jgi:transcriptional regulator with XRE-family HTH domain
MARIAGVSGVWISKIEAGHAANPCVEQVALCARALGVTEQWLMFGVKPKRAAA